MKDDSDKEDDKGGYKVGYGNPPKTGQFKKGQSGNPKGRPKIERNFLDLVGDLLESDLETENRVMSGHEAIHRATIKAALKGNQRAFKRFTRLAHKSGLFKDIDNRRKPFTGGVVIIPRKPIENPEEERAKLKSEIKKVEEQLAELRKHSGVQPTKSHAD